MMEAMLRRVARTWIEDFSVTVEESTGIVLACEPHEDQLMKDSFSRCFDRALREARRLSIFMFIFSFVLYTATFSIPFIATAPGVSVFLQTITALLTLQTFVVAILYHLRAADIRNTIIINRLMGRL